MRRAQRAAIFGGDCFGAFPTEAQKLKESEEVQIKAMRQLMEECGGETGGELAVEPTPSTRSFYHS